jgi:outer membrane biosynthesis protein TonB
MILLLAVMLTIAACEYLPFMAVQTPVPVPPSPTPTATPTPTPIPTPTPEVKKHKRHKHATRTPAATATPMAEETPAASAITTGESAAERKEIEHSLEQVEGRLSAIKRAQLSPPDAEDYDRIKSFLAEARSALQEQDTLRARSLVDKAGRLVAQLAGRVSNP